MSDPTPTDPRGDQVPATPAPLEQPATPRGRGRPTKLSYEVQEAICSTLRACGTVEDAAEMAGVDQATLYRWIKRGWKVKRGIYREFCEAVRRTLATRRVTREAIVINAGKGEKGDWRATAWMMERSDPVKYAPRVYQHVERELEGAIERLKEAFGGDPNRTLTVAEAYELALTAIAGGTGGMGIGPDAPGDPGEAGPPSGFGGEALLPPPAQPEAEAVPKP